MQNAGTSTGVKFKGVADALVGIARHDGMYAALRGTIRLFIAQDIYCPVGVGVWTPTLQNGFFFKRSPFLKPFRRAGALQRNVGDDDGRCAVRGAQVHDLRGHQGRLIQMERPGRA
jgi:hypothetical protein